MGLTTFKQALIILQERSSGHKGKGSVFQMSVPKEIVRNKRWKKGDTLIVTENQSAMIVRKLSPVKPRGDI